MTSEYCIRKWKNIYTRKLNSDWKKLRGLQYAGSFFHSIFLEHARIEKKTSEFSLAKEETKIQTPQAGEMNDQTITIPCV